MNITYLLAATALLSASVAGAVTVTSAPGAPDPYAGPLVISFDGANAPGYSWMGFTLNLGAAPAGDATNWGAITGTDAVPGMAMVTTPGVKKISFYWGSIDTFNSIQVLGAGGVWLKTVVGGDIPPADGNQMSNGTNRRVTLTAGPGEIITKINFITTGHAFEVDSFATSVPEPASWALMIAGFGLIGVAMRRRGVTVVAA